MFVALGGLHAQSVPSVEERLKALEQQVQGLARENAELKKQLGGHEATAPGLVAPGGKETKLTIGGFLQGQGEFGGAPDPRWYGVHDRFFFRRARIYVAGSFAEAFDFKAEIDLQGNTLSAGTGQLTRANEIFINWHKYPAMNLKFGQLKPAFGAEVLLSDTKMVTIERTLPSDRLADSRQLGISASGDLFHKKLSYLAMVGNGNGANSSANDNDKFQKSIRVAFTPVATAKDRVVFGVDGLWSDDAGITKPDLGLPGNLITGVRRLGGLDAQWTHGPLDLSTEWLRGTFEPTNGVPVARFTAEGAHVTASYFIVPAKFQAMVREEWFDPNTAVSGNTMHTLTLGLNYYLKGDDIKFMINYLIGDVPNTTAEGDRLLTRIQLVF